MFQSKRNVYEKMNPYFMCRSPNYNSKIHPIKSTDRELTETNNLYPKYPKPEKPLQVFPLLFLAGTEFLQYQTTHYW